MSLVKAKIHNVSVSSNTFSPGSLVIEAGDTVRWTNTGGNHNIKASDGSFRCAQGCEANGGNGTPSNTPWISEITFRTIGTTQYVCEPHAGSGMQGSITVIEPTSVTVREVHATTNNGFQPNNLTILQGDVVRFINDGGEHNINSVDDTLICSEGCLQDGTNTTSNPTGFSWDVYVKFEDYGETPYVCKNHEISGTPGIINIIEAPLFINGFE